MLLERCQSRASVILGAPATLLVAEMLSGIGREKADVLSIFAAALHLGLVVRLGKWLLFSCQSRNGSVGSIEQLRSCHLHSSCSTG